MRERLDDAQRSFERRALRNVRGLLDELEAEDRGRSIAGRRLSIAVVATVCAVLIAVLAINAFRAENGAVIAPSPTSMVRARETSAVAVPSPTPVTRGPVFTILHMDRRTGEFSFDDREQGLREVIEVDAGSDGDIRRAMVGRMIQQMRTHYQGNFRWESPRLGRVVTLSLRPEDNDGLEVFLIEEFFGAPARASR